MSGVSEMPPEHPLPRRVKPSVAAGRAMAALNRLDLVAGKLGARGATNQFVDQTLWYSERNGVNDFSATHFYRLVIARMAKEMRRRMRNAEDGSR